MNIYKQRRKAALKQMPSHSVLILFSATAKSVSNDTEYPFRQDSDFYYLSGFNEDNAAIVLIKSGNKQRVVMFVQPKDKMMELWTGKRAGIKKVKNDLSIKHVFSIKKLDEKLQKICQNKKAVYFDLFNKDKFIYIHSIISQIKNNRSLKFYPRSFLDATEILHAMRRRKSAKEIALIKKAIEITKKAHHHAMSIKKKDIYEYELQAEFEYMFKKHGAMHDAYTTIVAGGNNANTLHYTSNKDLLKEGDLILIDAGCQYDMYASDITRTIPVSGRFTSAQKDVYSLILDAQKEIISIIKPGVKFSDLQTKARELLCSAMITLGILSGKVDDLIRKDKDKRYYPHSIGHYMGLDVHDTCPYKDKNGEELPFCEGVVLTIEPGLYLDANDISVPKKYRGIAIRIEDDILVTKNGYQNLSIGIKKEIKDIEAYSLT